MNDEADNTGEVEEATFLESKKNGQRLVLLDGRKLSVNPGDISFVVCWTPTTRLEISEGEGVFPVNVRNTTSDEVITARWE